MEENYLVCGSCAIREPAMIDNSLPNGMVGIWPTGGGPTQTTAIGGPTQTAGGISPTAGPPPAYREFTANQFANARTTNLTEALGVLQGQGTGHAGRVGGAGGAG